MISGAKLRNHKLDFSVRTSTLAPVTAAGDATPGLRKGSPHRLGGRNAGIQQLHGRRTPSRGRKVGGHAILFRHGDTETPVFHPQPRRRASASPTQKTSTPRDSQSGPAVRCDLARSRCCSRRCSSRRRPMRSSASGRDPATRASAATSPIPVATIPYGNYYLPPVRSGATPYRHNAAPAPATAPRNGGRRITATEPGKRVSIERLNYRLCFLRFEVPQWKNAR